MNQAATILEAVTRETGWTEEEARLFIGCIRMPTPEALIEALPEAIAWAARIETAAAMINLMKTLPRGVLDASWTGSEVALRIDPGAKVAEPQPGHIEITPAPEAARDA